MATAASTVPELCRELVDAWRGKTDTQRLRLWQQDPDLAAPLAFLAAGAKVRLED